MRSVTRSQANRNSARMASCECDHNLVAVDENVLLVIVGLLSIHSHYDLVRSCCSIEEELVLVECLLPNSKEIP